MSAGGHKKNGPLPPEYHRLERVVRRLLDQNAAWRRRLEGSERKVAELQATVKRLSSGGLDPVELQRRLDGLTEENERLRARMAEAHDRVRRLVDRFEFLQEER